MISWVLVLGFVIKASLISAGECDSVGVTCDGIAAHYDITEVVYLCAVDFHGRDFIGFLVIVLKVYR